MQICKVCGETKSLVEFEKQKNRPSHRKTCKQCRYKSRDREKEKTRHREYMKQMRKTDPTKLRINWERSKYGVSKEDMGTDKCFICESIENLCIDHDHKTGEVRGMLCGSCNRGLGLFRDNPKLLSKAIEYLKDGPHWQLPFSRYPK